MYQRRSPWGCETRLADECATSRPSAAAGILIFGFVSLHRHGDPVGLARVDRLARLFDLFQDGFVGDRVGRGHVGRLGVEGDGVFLDALQLFEDALHRPRTAPAGHGHVELVMMVGHDCLLV